MVVKFGYGVIDSLVVNRPHQIPNQTGIAKTGQKLYCPGRLRGFHSKVPWPADDGRTFESAVMKRAPKSFLFADGIMKMKERSSCDIDDFNTDDIVERQTG